MGTFCIIMTDYFIFLVTFNFSATGDGVSCGLLHLWSFSLCTACDQNVLECENRTSSLLSVDSYKIYPLAHLRCLTVGLSTIALTGICVPPPTTGGGGMMFSLTFVRLLSIRRLTCFVWRDIFSLTGRISMRLATNNQHVSGRGWKGFSRSEVKIQGHLNNRLPSTSFG